MWNIISEHLYTIDVSELNRDLCQFENMKLKYTSKQLKKLHPKREGGYISLKCGHTKPGSKVDVDKSNIWIGFQNWYLRGKTVGLAMFLGCTIFL